MKVLLLGRGNNKIHLTNPLSCPDSYAKGKLKEHDVITFGFLPGTDILIDPNDDFTKVIEKLPKGWIPDLCVLWNVEDYLLPNGIEDAPFPIITIEMDWDFHIQLSKTIVEASDLVIAIGEFERQSILSIGAKNCEIFYSQGVPENLINPSPPMISERPYDIYYSTRYIDDVNHPERSMWLYKLSLLKGKYKVHIGDNTYYPKYLSDLSKAKLVFSYHRYGSMSSRVLDACSQGAVVIDPGDEVKRLLRPEAEYIPINKDDMECKIQMYLSNQDKLQMISCRAHEKVKINFGGQARFVSLIEYAQKRLRNNDGLRKLQKLENWERSYKRGIAYYYSSFHALHKYIPQEYLLYLSVYEFRKAAFLNHTSRPMTSLSVSMVAYAMLLFQHGKIDMANVYLNEAIFTLKEVISQEPSYIMAWFHLGLLYYRIGNFPETERALRTTSELLKDKNSNMDPWVLEANDFSLYVQLIQRSLNSNLLLLCKAKENQAIDSIRGTIEAAVYYVLHEIYKQEGKEFESLQFLLKSYELYSECPTIAKALSKVYASLDLKEKTHELYKKAISLLPLDLDLRIDFIKFLHCSKMYMQALDELIISYKICRTVPQRRYFMSVIEDMAYSYYGLNLSDILS